MPLRFLSTLFAMLVLSLAAGARADTRRVAVVVGNNVGGGSQPALRFAEADAEKLAHVLAELGGVRADDLTLLRGQDAAHVRGALAAARSKIQGIHQHGERAVLVFYFSGHSDGEALELARERLPFVEVRKLLEASGADLRVAIVDTCKSGALLAVKGGSATKPFQIRLSDELDSKGEALLTSSAASEVALESREIGGSFFTHHLVSGLRGAADRSADGRITLGEAYDYAFARTVSATARTVVGPQHPGYDYRIAGEGELVLAQLGKRDAQLALPADFDRALVLDLTNDRVLAEVPRAAVRTLALPEGRFRVIGWRGSQVFETELTLAKGSARVLEARELKVTRTPHLGAKGRMDGLEGPRPWYRDPAGSVAGGITRGIAAELGVLPSLRLGLELGRTSGLTVSVQGSSGEGESFRESAIAGALGGRYGFARGRTSFHAGAELGAGAIVQTVKGEKLSSPLAFFAPTLSGAFDLTESLALFAHAQAGGQLLRQDDATTVRFVPAGWLGLRLRR